MTPPLPWRASTPVDPAATYAVAITRLPLARHRRIPTVMRQTVRIVRALSRADGLVGYSLKADLIRKTFWTVSAWTSEAALQAFARSDVHGEAMTRVGPHMTEPQIAVVLVTGGELPCLGPTSAGGWTSRVRPPCAEPVSTHQNGSTPTRGEVHGGRWLVRHRRFVGSRCTARTSRGCWPTGGARPDHPALVWAPRDGEGRRWTYEESDRRASDRGRPRRAWHPAGRPAAHPRRELARDGAHVAGLRDVGRGRGHDEHQVGRRRDHLRPRTPKRSRP